MTQVNLKSFFLLLFIHFFWKSWLQNSLLNHQSAHGLTSFSCSVQGCKFRPALTEHSFLFQRSCQFVLIFHHVERMLFGTPYFAATSLFVIFFSKSFKALHVAPIGLLFNLRFIGTIFLSQRTKNGLFMFSRIECMIRKSWNVRILVKKFEFYWKSSEK